MKKIIFLASVAALFFAAGCQQQSAATAVASTSGPVQTAASSNIAYFNLDSLLLGYNMYLDMRADFEVKTQKADSELTTKGRALESDVVSYQEKVQKGLVTRAQAAELEQQLSVKQQELVQYRDQLVANMAEEEQVMLNNIQNSITEYIAEFNSDYRYGVIMSTNTSGPIYNADPSLNITAEIIKGLNERYAASKK